MMGGGEPRRNLASFNQTNRDAWIAGLACKIPKASSVLDLGAGMGRHGQLFAHCRYIAQDFGRYEGTNSGLMREAWAYASLDIRSEASAIPLRTASVDYVLCTEVLEHVPEPIAVIREIGRVLRPGGGAYLSAPLGCGLHQQPYHFYGGFTPHFYRRMLPTAGLAVVSVEPNGRFFRLFLQELHRAAHIIIERRGYKRYHVARWMLRLVTSDLVARWLTRLDDEMRIDEFTAGYHVEATRVSRAEGEENRRIARPTSSR